ncbi:MAG: penicillin-binding protein activator LpoB [Deltaproteobacteria bacterium]|nr:penicillin-binding protein activator LpoB [Deltaproteobacteria bacterium]
MLKQSSRRRLFPLAAVAIAIAASGCAPKKTVTRTASDSAEGGDLSGYWNDIDANLVATEMIKDCMSRPWAADYQEASGGKKATVKLMPAQKRTDDRNVNEEYFTRQVEKELLNSGRVKVVAGWTEQDMNVVERARQATHASDETVKGQGNETGADFTLQTVINSQNETDGRGGQVRAYLVNMMLINVESNEKVWMGEKKIRKVVDQAGTSW